jgi:hypothetical protein
LPDVPPFELRKHEVEARLSELEQTNYAPPPLLTGDDLVAAGWTPGPVFKRVLDQVYDAQLEDNITTKQQALELANQLRQSSAAVPARAKGARRGEGDAT